MRNNPYVGMCFFCGHAITKFELGADIRGTYIDYTKGESGEMTVSICGECWLKSCEFLNLGLAHAINKRNKIAIMDSEDNDERDDWLTP